MAREPPTISGAERWAPPVLIDRLPIPVPFTFDEWGDLDFSDAFRTRAFAEYFERSVREVMQGNRAPIYLDALAMLLHIGRLSEFDDDSFGNFMHEAHGQRFTVSQLDRALMTIWAACSKSGGVPNAAAAFEFLACSVRIVQEIAETRPHSDRLIETINGAWGMARVVFGIAVCIELGYGDDCWVDDESDGDAYTYD